jgi:AhpC/TSA family
MKRISAAVPLAFGLALCGLSCQRAAQPCPDASSAGVTNSSNAAKTSAESQTPSAPQTQLKVGDQAPDFTLNDTEGQPVKLSDFRGKKNVVLAFYVLAFTGG